jgi:hypothetical protein
MIIKRDSFIDNKRLRFPFLFLSFILNILDKGIINPKTGWLKTLHFSEDTCPLLRWTCPDIINGVCPPGNHTNRLSRNCLVPKQINYVIERAP